MHNQDDSIKMIYKQMKLEKDQMYLYLHITEISIKI